MTTISTLVLVAAKTVTVVLGTVLALLATRAYRRTRSPALGALALGIATVTAGAFAGGVLHQVVGVALPTAVAVQAVCTALGFAVLTYSVYAAGDGPDESFTVGETDAETG